MGVLYIVSTPIGNLEDMTLRALRILKEVDFVLCEDTRVTKKLLDHYDIKTPMISYHQHSSLQKLDSIVELLLKGQNLALVSDAGTPGISDPGNQLVAEVAEKLSEVQIVPIPGASAVTAVASIAGFSMDKFLFLGFPPAKKGRKTFFEYVAQADHPVIFYESPHRILKSLSELQQIPNAYIVVARELTKKFETVYRGNVDQVIENIKQDSQKGEFAVVVRKSTSLN